LFKGFSKGTCILERKKAAVVREEGRKEGAVELLSVFTELLKADSCFNKEWNIIMDS